MLWMPNSHVCKIIWKFPWIKKFWIRKLRPSLNPPVILKELTQRKKSPSQPINDYHSNFNFADEKVVIAIGVEGAGCSSFGNLLAKEELYPASCDLRSHTRESVVKQHLRFRETGLHMIYIDTIGNIIHLKFWKLFLVGILFTTHNFLINVFRLVRKNIRNWIHSVTVQGLLS